MDTTTCTTIVLVLIWLSLSCHALGSLATLIRDVSTTDVLSTTTTLSTVLLGVCLWQCKKVGYLVSPMTWYHWVLLVLLVVLQVVAILQQLGWGVQSHEATSAYPIYGVAITMLGTLGGTLYCGWKCNLFCRPCCKSQYICYGTAIVVALVALVILALTVSLARFQLHGVHGYTTDGQTDIFVIGYLGYMVVPLTQIYTMAVIWITILRIPYTVPEVMTLLASALAVSSLLALAICSSTLYQDVTKGYALLALHLVALVITLYCLEYKRVFYWPKDQMCFGLMAAVVILVALAAIYIVNSNGENGDVDVVSYVLLCYSLVLLVPTLWYAYRCGLLTWRWNSCLPKKKGLKGTDTAENTIPDNDIAKES